MSQVIRRHLFYSGNVQGVGFRWTCRRISGGYAVVGFVQNLSDGRVELVADGEKREVQAFLDEIAEQMRGNIEDVADCSDQQLIAEPSFAQFSIRR